MSTGDTYCSIHGFERCMCNAIARFYAGDRNMDEFKYFDEYPHEDPFVPSEKDTLKYKDEAVCRFLDAADEVHEFLTFREMIKLLAENV